MAERTLSVQGASLFRTRLQRHRAALTRQDQRLLDAYQMGALELDELKVRRQLNRYE